MYYDIKYDNMGRKDTMHNLLCGNVLLPLIGSRIDCMW